MIQEKIAKLVKGIDLTETEMVQFMNEIMEGRVSPAQTGAFLVALRIKGETIDEITGAARVMREKCTPVTARNSDPADPVLDTCGTGGDSTGTFNVSTAAAFVAAGAGVRVAKHGNRSVSSNSGSADLVESMGISLEMTPETMSRCLAETGITFMFAPRLHSAMKHVVGPRREIGLRTIFNMLGPLTNPAGASAQVIGVYDPALTTPLAGVLGKLGCRNAMVVHGDGFDELTVTGPSHITHLTGETIREITITPEELGLPRHELTDLKAADVNESRKMVLSVLAGDRGAPRDMVLINSSAALVTAGKCNSLKDGIRLAAETIDSGKAMAKVEELIAFSNGSNKPSK